MHNGKGQKDCKPYTASLSHSPHLEESSCGSHFEMRELPQEKYSYVCVYIKVSHNKCEMADGKQIYLFIYVFVYLCICPRNHTLALIFLNLKLTLILAQL